MSPLSVDGTVSGFSGLERRAMIEHILVERSHKQGAAEVATKPQAPEPKSASSASDFQERDAAPVEPSVEATTSVHPEKTIATERQNSSGPVRPNQVSQQYPTTFAATARENASARAASSVYPQVPGGTRTSERTSEEAGDWSDRAKSRRSNQEFGSFQDAENCTFAPEVGV